MGLPRTYWVLWLGTLVNRLGGFVAPFLALYLTDARHLTAEEAGVIVSLYGVGTISAGPVGGALADVIGRRTTLLLGLVLGAVNMVALGFATQPLIIGILGCSLGFLGDLFRPAAAALIADVVPAEDRTRAFGLQYWAVNVGFSVSTSLAGVLAGFGFIWLFVGDATTTLLYAVVVLVALKETPLPRRGSHAQEHNLRGMGIAFTDGVFMTFTALSFLLALLFFQFQVTLPLSLRAHGFSAREFGWIIAANGVVIVLVQPFVNRWLGTARRARLLAVASVLTGTGFALNAFVHSVGGYLTGVVLWTLGEIASSPSSSSLVADLAPDHARGRYQGAFYMSWGLASAVAPALGTTVMQRYGERTLWLGCGVLGLVVAAGHLLAASPRRRHLLRLHPARVASE